MPRTAALVTFRNCRLVFFLFSMQLPQKLLQIPCQRTHNPHIAQGLLEDFINYGQWPEERLFCSRSLSSLDTPASSFCRYQNVCRGQGKRGREQSGRESANPEDSSG